MTKFMYNYIINYWWRQHYYSIVKTYSSLTRTSPPPSLRIAYSKLVWFKFNKKENKEEKEWIWVEGYKGTDKDMKCRDFQFEIGKEYSVLKDEEPVMCEKGFHLCLKLSDVFTYYDICNNNRFFAF